MSLFSWKPSSQFNGKHFLLQNETNIGNRNQRFHIKIAAYFQNNCKWQFCKAHWLYRLLGLWSTLLNTFDSTYISSFLHFARNLQGVGNHLSSWSSASRNNSLIALIRHKYAGGGLMKRRNPQNALIMTIYVSLIAKNSISH
jgi:hypothetical protein